MSEQVEPVVVYYFGCWGTPGHRLYRQSGSSISDTRCLDGVFCGDPSLAQRDRQYGGKLRWDGTEQAQPQGRVRVVHARLPLFPGTTTVAAFWDRSGDRRYGSNSAFVAQGEHDFATITEAARVQFPVVWKRITSAFPLVESAG